MNLPDFIKARGGQAKDVQQHRRPSTPNASPLAELSKSSTQLQGQLASFALSFPKIRSVRKHELRPLSHIARVSGGRAVVIIRPFWHQSCFAYDVGGYRERSASSCATTAYTM